MPPECHRLIAAIAVLTAILPPCPNLKELLSKILPSPEMTDDPLHSAAMIASVLVDPRKQTCNFEPSKKDDEDKE